MELSYSIVLDGYGVLFGGCVLIFSCGYIGGEFNKKRFSFLVLSFVISMLLLVFSGNLIGVLLG